MASAWLTHRTWTPIGRALLAADQPQTPRQIAEALGRDSSNVKADLEEMREEGLVERGAPPARTGKPGRPTAATWALAAAHVSALETAIQSASAVGAINRGQQVVFASAAGRPLPELLDVLADAQMTAGASWSALLDGGRQEFMVVFDGRDSAEQAIQFEAALSRVDVPAHRAAVTRVQRSDELVKRAARASRAARRARMRSDTQKASQRDAG
jgi:hypothetical protein